MSVAKSKAFAKIVRTNRRARFLHRQKKKNRKKRRKKRGKKKKKKKKRKSFTIKAKFVVFFLNNKQVRKTSYACEGGYQNIFISRYQGIIISYHILSTTNQPTPPIPPPSPSLLYRKKEKNNKSL